MDTHRVPASTYRLQLNSSFTFDDAASQVPYLARLGVSHLFCSPILQAAPGSMHGYDVVDHTRISQECGGEEGFRRLAAAASAHGLGIVVDVVPNHMAVPTPLWHNRALWEALRDGADSRYATWFDIDLTVSRAVLMPVLGGRIGDELAAGNIRVEQRVVDGLAQRVVVYFDHVFPVRPGTEDLPIDQLLERQWYRLAYWKVANEELNYRRFFDVDTLAAIRVEDNEVFDATHELLIRLHDEGLIEGFRIDHPDGLATPRGYLQRLQRATGGAWVVVEKILEPHETLPEGSRCAGTTGYDALLHVAGLFHDPGQLPFLDEAWDRIAHEGWFGQVLVSAKQEVVRTMLFTEVNRLISIAVAICESDIRLFDHTRRELGRAIAALLVQMDRYRAYVEPGIATPDTERRVILDAAERVRPELDDDEASTLDLVVMLVLGDSPTGDGGGAETLPIVTRHPVTTELPETVMDGAALRAEFMIRFAQTCGPVMAKSKEDCAFYRWNRFIAVNEVGSEPTLVGITPDTFHDFCTRLSTDWPETMTTLSTHDTKRSEDVRARLSALLEHARAWESCLAELRAATEEQRSPLVDGATELLLWQSLAATWRLPGTQAGERPVTVQRLSDYLTKAVREAKLHTSWTAPEPAYEEAIVALATAALRDVRVAEALDAFVAACADSLRAIVLGTKLIQLTMPGVPDLYQGTEVVDLSLVDPDNRRPVDFTHRALLLDSETTDGLDAEKLWVVSHALRLRGAHPEAFRGPEATYTPVATTSGHAVAFARGTQKGPVAVTVATRLGAQLAERGGWGDHQVVLPEGAWADVLSGRTFPGGAVPLSELLDGRPVALLGAR